MSAKSCGSSMGDFHDYILELDNFSKIKNNQHYFAECYFCFYFEKIRRD